MQDDEVIDFQKRVDERNYEERMKAKLFDVSRRAAEKLREMSDDKSAGAQRRGPTHSVDGKRSVKAELDAMR